MPLVSKNTCSAAAGLILLLGVCPAWGQIVPPGRTPQTPPSEGETATDPASLLVAYRTALREGNLLEVERSLTALWAADLEQARTLTLSLLRDGRPHERPIALTHLITHGDAALIAAAARSLSPINYPDERRQLVQSLGKKGVPGLQAIQPFVEDRDPWVQVVAIHAITEINQPAGLHWFIRQRQPMPGKDQTIRGNGPSRALLMATNAGTYKLTKIHPENDQLIREWVRQNARLRVGEAGSTSTPTTPPSQQTPPSEDTPAATAEGRRISTQRFDIYFELNRPEELKQILKAGEIANLDRLGRQIERYANTADRAAQALFGPYSLPPTVLIFADQSNFSKYGGPSHGLHGYASGHRIVTRLDRWEDVSTVLPHEYVHIAHLALYPSQPRWLSEGLAESLSKSPTHSIFGSDRVKELGLDAALAKQGAFATLLRWNSGPSTNAQAERQLYALAHLTLDYLRFAELSARESRLNMLMSRINRGERPESALTAVYGRSLRDLDAALLKWVQSRPAQPTPPGRQSITPTRPTPPTPPPPSTTPIDF